jgi:hypothetical protein
MCYALCELGPHRICWIGYNVMVFRKTLLFGSIGITFSAYGAAFGHYQLLAFAVMWRG